VFLGYLNIQALRTKIVKQCSDQFEKQIGSLVAMSTSTTLALFWHLSSPEKKERIDASVKLVCALEQFQAQFVPQPKSHSDEEDDDSDEEEEKERTPRLKGKSDRLDDLNAQDVSYSIRRLIRGLASPRESSRLGFAVTLTEVGSVTSMMPKNTSGLDSASV